MRYWFLLGGLLLAPAAHAAARVTDVSLSRDARGWRVDVKASVKARYTVHALPSPDRLIIDVPDATLDIDSRVRPVSARPGGVTLRYSQFTRKPDSVRIVVDLPDASAWREISASPAMSIAVAIPAASAPTAPSAPVQPLKAVRTAKAPAAATALTAPATPQRRWSPVRASRPKRPAPTVLSAREMERRLREAGRLPEHAKGGMADAGSPSLAPAPSAPRPVRTRRARPRRADERGKTAASNALKKDDRSAVASRGGYVDRTDLMATLMALPEVGTAPDAPGAPGASGSAEGRETPGPPAEAVAPAWLPEDAIALINEGDCPEPLRRRLIEIVSDPAIRTSHYVWGAQSPGQFDCSGLALYVYGALDVRLPRVSSRQAEVGVPVDRSELRAGDLVFFNTRGASVSHVGIYLGGGRFLHAANPRANLQITSLDSAYYAKRFVSARRVYSPAFAATDSNHHGG